MYLLVTRDMSKRGAEGLAPLAKTLFCSVKTKILFLPWPSVIVNQNNDHAPPTALAFIEGSASDVEEHSDESYAGP